MPSPEAPAPTAYGYVRVSGLAQVKDGQGLEIQRERIAGWCGYQAATLASVESDEGISGASTDNRPGLRRALRAAVSHGPGATFVVYKLDRLGRNALDVQENLAVLLDAGVRVVALNDGVDSGSGMGAAVLKLLTGILATFAELEKETIAGRLQSGRQHAKAHGRVYSREAAYGLRPAEAPAAAGELVEDAGELAAVARIKTLRGEGRSYRAICAALNAEGLVPRHGGAWGPGVVQRLATGQRAPAPRKTSARIAGARAALLAGES